MNRDEEMEFDDHDDDQDEEDEDVTLPVQIPPSTAVTGYENSRMKLGGVDSGRKLGGSTSSGLVAPPPSRYRECLKNHAVGIGGHAVDGCGEFMPAGEEGTLDALKCAACNCHRNFHRKEVEGSESSSIFHHPSSAGGHPPPPAPLQFSPYYRTPSGYNLHVAAAHRPLQALALPSTSGGHSRDDQDDVSGGGGGSGGERIGKKRYRTKFSQEQKEKMLAFAERVGWRIQKHDEAAVQQFCMETCVKRHVLKVWMHNNKHTLGKKIINTATNMPACL